MRVDGPVFLLNERFDLALTLDDQAKSDGLYASGGEAAADFVPEQRRNLVADDAVEHAARLLGIDQVAIDRSRVLEGVLHGALGDFVERHPADIDVGLPFFFFVPSKLSPPSSSARCAAMASPSRSGSGAR